VAAAGVATSEAGAPVVPSGRIAAMLAVSALVSSLHLLALAIGLPAVTVRGRALRGPLDDGGLRRLFTADNLWAVAAGLWLVTGLLRAFAGLEKGTAFYLASPLFWTKMALFASVVVLEIHPMVTFIRWRAALRQGRRPDTAAARKLYVLNHVEMALVVVIVFVASFMARGF
jgi:putative membrane protein